MRQLFFRFPNGVMTSGAAVCAALVLLLQHATPCALWLEERLFAMSFYGLARDVPQLLTRIGDVMSLERLNGAEKAFSDSVSTALMMPLAEEIRDFCPEEPEKSTQEAVGKDGVLPEEVASVPERTGAVPVASESVEEKSEKLPEEELVAMPLQEAAAKQTSQTSAADAEEAAVVLVEEHAGTAQPVAECPEPLPLEQCPHEQEDREEAQRMPVGELRRPLNMADALEYALDSGGGRRVSAPKPVFRPTRQTRVHMEEKPKPQYERQHQSDKQRPMIRRMTQVSSTVGNLRRKRESRRMATVKSVMHVRPSLPPTAEPQTPRAPQESAPAASPGETPPMRCRILMLGDSLMEDLGPMTHRLMRHRKGLEFIISAKYSTGLCRPDYFNWPEHMSGVVRRYAPDLVIFFIGANDGMPIRQERGLVPTGGEAWREAYAAKMDELVSIARNAGVDVIWVEMPAVGGFYNKLLHQTQIAQRMYCESNGIATLQTDPFLSGEWGRFEPYGDYHGSYTRLRTKDQTHLTRQGNLKVLDHLLPVVEQHLSAFYARHPERRLSAQDVERIRRVPAVYTCQYVPPRSRKVHDKKTPPAGTPPTPTPQ